MSYNRSTDEQTARFRYHVILEIVKGTKSEKQSCDEHGIPPWQLHQWYERFLKGALNSLRREPQSDPVYAEIDHEYTDYDS